LNLVIDKKQFKLSIEELTATWFNFLDEAQDRIRINVGQERIKFDVHVRATFDRCAIFNKPTGGDVIWGPATVTWHDKGWFFNSSTTKPRTFYPGDAINCKLTWL